MEYCIRRVGVVFAGVEVAIVEFAAVEVVFVIVKVVFATVKVVFVAVTAVFAAEAVLAVFARF